MIPFLNSILLRRWEFSQILIFYTVGIILFVETVLLGCTLYHIPKIITSIAFLFVAYVIDAYWRTTVENDVFLQPCKGNTPT